MRLPATPALVLALLALPLGAQSPTADPVPLADEVVANVYQGWEQEWGKVAVSADGSRFAVAWNAAVSTAIWASFFDFDGTPLSGDVQANPVFNAFSQDEPMCAADGLGNVFVCWSDRGNSCCGGQPNDGDKMGVFGRVFTSAGVPLGPDFQINQTWMESQWEPMPAALPGGGWVVAFNGDDDGNAYLRFLDTDGTPRTGDLLVNTYLNNGQTEAEVNVAGDGTVLAVYSDFGGNVFPFTQTNLFARRFDSDGNPLDLVEFPVHASVLDFDQLEPRIAASADAFVIVWEDRGNDGSGAGIFARRFASDGSALGPEFMVNVVTADDQRLPEVASDAAGNFVVCWEDRSTGVGQIHARAFGADGTPLSVGFVVSGDAVSPNGYQRPEVSMSDDGSRIVFAYGGPGTSRGNNSQDIYYRRYAWEMGPGAAPLAGRAKHRPAPSDSPSPPGPFNPSAVLP